MIYFILGLVGVTLFVALFVNHQMKYSKQRYYKNNPHLDRRSVRHSVTTHHSTDKLSKLRTQEDHGNVVPLLKKERRDK